MPFDELAELNRLVGIPIAGGKNNRGVHEYRWMLEQNVFDILQPDIMVADGVTGFREIGALARKPTIESDSSSRRRQSRHHRPAHAIASWPHAPWIEILHFGPPIAAYTNGFIAIMENPPLVDKEGYLNFATGAWLGIFDQQGFNRFVGAAVRRRIAFRSSGFQQPSAAPITLWSIDATT